MSERYTDAPYVTGALAKADREIERLKKRKRRSSAVFAVLMIACAIFSYYLGEMDGYISGENAGYSAGFDHGKTQGEAAGYESGYHRGHSEGYEKGTHDGYRTGYAAAGYNKSEASNRNYSASNSSSSAETAVRESKTTYIGNINSRKFHLPICSYLPNSENQIFFDGRGDAIAQGYDPCQHCNP